MSPANVAHTEERPRLVTFVVGPPFEPETSEFLMAPRVVDDGSIFDDSVERRHDWDRRVAHDIGEIAQHLKDVDGNFLSLIAKLATDKTTSNAEARELKEKVEKLHDAAMRREGRQQAINFVLGAAVGVFALIQIAQAMHVHIGGT